MAQWHALRSMPSVLLRSTALHLLRVRNEQCVRNAEASERDTQGKSFALQGFRFGNDKEAALKVVDMGFEMSPAPSNSTYKSAIDTMSLVSH